MAGSTVPSRDEPAIVAFQPYGGMSMRTTAVTLDDDGLVGEFAVPDLPGPCPAVLVFGGSGGGHPGAAHLPALTSQGFAVLALTYFAAPGLPATLSEIPLEYFDRALAWLQSQEEVTPTECFVMGRSRGSEAAQLLALRHPQDVAALVLGVPTYVVVKAYPGDGAAWTHAGRPLPFHPQGWPYGEYPADAPAAIPLENYPGPVLCVAAGRDDIWPAAEFAGVITARRSAKNRRTETLLYPDAGHGVGVMVEPDSGETSADALARRDAWPQVVAFMRSQCEEGRAALS